MARWPLLASLLPLLAAGNPAWAKLSGELELEQRYFLQPAPVPNRQQSYYSLGGQLQYDYSSERGRRTFLATVAGRHDFEDPDRRYLELLDFEGLLRYGAFEFGAGVRRIFWGVTEAVSLVDVVNQTDLRNDVSGDAKLGQPMLNVAWFSSFGTFEAFALPLFRERPFPGPEGRFAVPFPLLEDDRQYVLGASEHSVDQAYRWSHSLLNMDVALSYFSGNVRDPRIVACIRQGSGFAGTETGNNCDIDSAIPDGGALGQLLQTLNGAAPGTEDAVLPVVQVIADLDPTGVVPNQRELTQAFLDAIVIVPFYEPLQQLGFEWQWNFGDLALKAEGTRRELAKSTPVTEQNSDEVVDNPGNAGGRPANEKQWLSAAAAGFEYTLVGVFGSAVDVGLIGEYLYNENDRTIVANFDDDFVAATRLEFNDVNTTRIIAGVIQDSNNHGRYYLLDASRRLSRRWSMQLEGLWLSNIPDDDPAAFFADEDLLTLRLTRFY